MPGQSPLNRPATETDKPSANGFQAFQVPGFGLFWLGSVFSILGQQILSVAIGWELYDLTHSATVLGLVGAVQALPIVGLALWSGSLADRYNRRTLVLLAQMLMATAAGTMALVSSKLVPVTDQPVIHLANRLIAGTAHALGETTATFTDPHLPLYFFLLFLVGTARVLNNPSRVAIVPRLVPGEVLTNAITWNTSAMHIAATLGPALGAVLVSLTAPSRFEYALAYAADAVCALIMFFAFLSLPAAIGEPLKPAQTQNDGPKRRNWLDGARHVFRERVLIASITLDMLAVLFGGCTALLPIFAREILKTDVVGYSWLRAAPSIGAVAMGFFLAYRPPRRRVGLALMASVVAFGLATIGFGLSRNYTLSIVMLALIGAFDNISVVIRNTLVQLRTPDDLRGRVSAVNGVFIGTSNELGALESGLTAAMWGPVASVVAGGFCTIIVVIAIGRIWPELTRLATLERQTPAG
jgi:MFS family permease